jgi:hypothetical protein
LAERLKGTVGLEGSSASVLNVRGRPKSLLEMDRAALRELRAPLLKPFGAEFDAPAGVALNLLGDDAVVIQNFRDEAVDVRVRLESMPTPELRLAIPGDLEVSLEREGGGEIGALRATVGARGLIVLR